MKKLFNENMLRFATNGEKNLVLKENLQEDEVQEESAFHACASHVRENKSGAAGRCINHTLLKNGTVTHYTVEFKNVVVESIPVEALTVLKENRHLHKPKRDDYELEESDKPRMAYLEEDEDGQRAQPLSGDAPRLEEESELEEQSAPDDLSGLKGVKGAKDTVYRPEDFDPDAPPPRGRPAMPGDFDDAKPHPMGGLREAIKKALKGIKQRASK